MLEKPRREANPSNQDINPSEGVKLTHQSDVREAKKRGQSVKTRILIHQRGYPTHQSDVREAKKRANPSNKDIDPPEGVNQPTKATSEKPRRGPIRQTRILIHQRGLINPPNRRQRSQEEGQSVKTRILIHQRGYPNPPKRRQRSQEERPIRQIKDIDPSEGVSKPIKATLEKPRREANPSKTRILIHQRGHLNPSKRRQRSQEERPIRQNTATDPPEGASKPTKVTSEKPRRGPIRQTRISIHQRGLTNPPKQKQKKPRKSLNIEGHC